jgi:hypothetical protein
MINLKILKYGQIADVEKCTTLNEKTIVSDMMLRRRLTRNARIALYLADQIGAKQNAVVIGNGYGEVSETYDILRAIYEKSSLSPTAFQNSVHNTPASYLSIVEQNRGYITTVSDLQDTALSVLKVGAVKSLQYPQLALMVTDSINFDRISEINHCGIEFLEGGTALLVTRTTEEATITLRGKSYPKYSRSLWPMLEIIEQCEALPAGCGAIISIAV